MLLMKTASSLNSNIVQWHPFYNVTSFFTFEINIAKQIYKNGIRELKYLFPFSPELINNLLYTNTIVTKGTVTVIQNLIMNFDPFQTYPPNSFLRHYRVICYIQIFKEGNASSSLSC